MTHSSTQYNENAAGSQVKGHLSLPQEPASLGSPREIGFSKSGPAAVGFLSWIAAEARRDNIDHILLMSPAGRVLQKMASLRRDPDSLHMPQVSTMLGSRIALTLAGMDAGCFDASFLLSESQGLGAVEVLERIGVPAPADHVLEDIGLGSGTLLNPSTRELMRGLLEALRWEILKVCQRNRRGLFRHLLDLGVRAGHRIALVDIGWDGEAQEAFKRALHGVMPLETLGYNFCLTDSHEFQRRREELQMRALVNTDNSSSSLIQAVSDNRAVCEFLLAPTHAQTVGYVEAWTRVIDAEDRSRAPIVNLSYATGEIEAGMLDFASRNEPLGVNATEAATPLLQFIAGGEWRKDPLLKQVRNVDSWTSFPDRDKWLTDYGLRKSDPSE